MVSRSHAILSSLRAGAALRVVEHVCVGGLASFEIDAYVECRSWSAAYALMCYDFWNLKLIAYPDFGLFTPEAMAARQALIPRDEVMTIAYAGLIEARVRLRRLTRDMTNAEFRHFCVDASRHQEL